MQSTKRPEELTKFKDSLGRWLTISIFADSSVTSDKYEALYTLKPSDKYDLPCLRTLYLEMGDVTEFAFAETYLGGWAHWEAICQSWELKPFVAEWREALEMKRKALLLRQIEEHAGGEGPNALNAAKYLLETTTEFKASKRGRPSKVEKEAALAKANRSSLDIAKDAERLGIKVVS